MIEVTADELGRKIASSLTEHDPDSPPVLDAFIASIRGILSSGSGVVLPAFGAFRLVGPDGNARPVTRTDRLIADLGGRLRVAGPEKASAVLSRVLDVLRAELLGGRKVVLGDLGAFEVANHRPEIERQPLGWRLIRPARSELSFTPLNAVRTPAGEARLSFDPDPDLRGRLERAGGSSILLLADQKDFFTETLAFYFTRAGWELDVVTDAGAAAHRAEVTRPFLAIVDASRPEPQTFCRALKLRPQTAGTPLILLHPDSSWTSPREVVVAGDANLGQPFEFRQLLEVAEAEIQRAAEEDARDLHQVHLRLPSADAAVERAVEDLQSLLRWSGLDDQGETAMSAAFREAVVNAAQHGNRRDRDKAIAVRYRRDAAGLRVSVEDQGGGFDHRDVIRRLREADAMSAARARHAEGRTGGLGIMMMLRCCDEVEFNEAGNQVTLVRRFAR